MLWVIFQEQHFCKRKKYIAGCQPSFFPSRNHWQRLLTTLWGRERSQWSECQGVKSGWEKIGPLDDAFQLFAWKGRWESSGAIEISGLKRCYFCLYDLWKKLLCCCGKGASRKERSDGWSKMLELMSAQRWVIASDIEDDVRRMWVNIYKEQQ